MQALKEAFEVFCNKCVAGSTNVELLTTFCDNLLKKSSSKKLCDEIIEDTFANVKWFPWNSEFRGWNLVHFVGYDWDKIFFTLVPNFLFGQTLARCFQLLGSKCLRV